MSVTRTDFIARDVACNTNVNMVTTADKGRNIMQILVTYSIRFFVGVHKASQSKKKKKLSVNIELTVLKRF